MCLGKSVKKRDDSIHYALTEQLKWPRTKAYQVTGNTGVVTTDFLLR